MSPPLRCAKLVRGSAARGKQPCSSRLRAHAALARVRVRVRVRVRARVRV